MAADGNRRLPGARGSSVRWRTCRFGELSVVELQRIYRARQEVFALEQDCVYLDVDGLDECAFHVSAWDDAGPPAPVPLAYARLLDPGARYTEASMGRVLTTTSARGTGLGRELVRRVLALSGEQHAGVGIRISAQARLERFYAAFGFGSVGAAYIEDGIPHLEMLRAAA